MDRNPIYILLSHIIHSLFLYFIIQLYSVFSPVYTSTFHFPVSTISPSKVKLRKTLLISFLFELFVLFSHIFFAFCFSFLLIFSHYSMPLSLFHFFLPFPLLYINHFSHAPLHFPSAFLPIFSRYFSHAYFCLFLKSCFYLFLLTSPYLYLCLF